MLTTIRKRFIMCFVILTILLGGIGLDLILPNSYAWAESSTKEATLAAKEIISIDDVQELTKFVDGKMEASMNSLFIPGAVISIVKDGKLLMAKGYGSANLEEGTAVDPNKSLFRIASTTKLFTWTAVMQLVEQGKIDLDENVNSYLKTFKIPDTYAEPITMRHLMTHTAGFEEGGVGYQITTDLDKLPGSISETLTKHRLARVRPPGEMSSYSNYGTTLAGLVIEEVSGLKYEDYIQRNIFDLLDMKYASVEEPIPTALEPYKVIGYTNNDGSFKRGTPTFEGGFRPAGSGSVSAVDMAHFMIAHLQDGRYEDKQLLQEATVALMHAPAFQFDPRMPGVSLGFAEKRINGITLIAHGGADPQFNTELYLAPEKGLGIFVSFNGGPGNEAADGLIKELFARYYPATEPELPIDTTVTSEILQKYTGSYQFTRRNFTHIDKFFSFFVQINLTQSDNMLTLGSGSEQEFYVPVGEHLFQKVNGSEQLGFHVDNTGKVTHMLISALPDMPLERTSLLDRNQLWFVIMGISSFIFLTVLVELIIRRRQIKDMTIEQRKAMMLLVKTAGWGLASLLIVFSMLMSMDVLTKLTEVSIFLKLALLMPMIMLMLTLRSIVSAVFVWSKGYWSVLKRVHYTLVVGSAIAFCWFFYYWNLLGWKFG